MNTASNGPPSSERLLERLRRDAVGHPELGVVLGRDEPRQAAGQHQPVDHAGVRVALDQHARAGARERQAQRVVALGRAVGQKPAVLGPVGLGRETLGALIRRRRGTEVDPLDVLRDIEQQRAGPSALRSPGSAPPPPLWPGTWKRVEPRRP